MAETTTKIFEVDTGKAITNLKEYKQYLDDLKGALLGLKEGTDEYNKIAKDLRDGQAKLNDVMDIARGKNTEVEGSYNALDKQLKELRKSYRNLSEDARNSPVGTAMLEGISDLDSKLRDMDLELKQYFRNIGNYQSVWEGAFDKMLQPLGNMGGVLGTLSKDVKGMIPLIKQVNSTAITGLQGVKAAIASTGIGLLIIAVGELAANWQSVYNWITGVDSITDDLANTQKQVTEQTDAQLKNIGYQAQIMQAQGKTQVQILQFEYDETKLATAKLMVYRDILKTKIDELEAHGVLEKLGKGEYAIISELKKNYDETNTKIGEMTEKLKGMAVSLKAAQIKADLDNLKDLAAKGKAAAEQFKAMKEKAADFIQGFKEINFTDREKLQKAYDENLETLKAFYDAGVIKEKEYQEALQLIKDKFRKDNFKLDWEEIEKRKEKELAAQNEVDKATLEGLKKTFDEIDKKTKGKKIDIEFNYKNVGNGNILQTLFGIKGKEQIEAELNRVIEEIKKNANDALDASKQKVAELELAMADLVEGTDAWKKVNEQITAELEKQHQITEQSGNAIVSAQTAASQAITDETFTPWQKAAQYIQQAAQMVDSYIGILNQMIQQDVQNGKISEEQAKKRFKNIKALQYSSIIMQAAAGSIIAMVTGIRDLGLPWGAIVGGIQATAIQIQAALQAAVVSKQKFGSTGGANLSTPNLAPITNEYTPQYVQNVQTQSELSELSNAMGNISPVVSVVDIEDGLETSKVRVEENTF